MEKKYLLYTDILGFSNMVREKPEEARRLYYIIENLNCHNHDAFKVIVFSDTILIYNIAEPLTDRDHEYYVMFLIEFAQNLLYCTIGKGYYFRSIIVYGYFEHDILNNIERYFGDALIKAYLTEKDIPCTGLFIDSNVQKYNDIFPTEEYNKNISFVYLNQSLDRLLEGEIGEIPVDKYLLFQTDSQWHLAKDIRMLSDIHRMMRYHPQPRVRQKFLMTWDFYCRRYEPILSKLEAGAFSPEVISPDFEWREANSRLMEGYRGYCIEPPPQNELELMIEEARRSGAEAAKREFINRFGTEEKPPFFLPCGYSRIILDIGGRNKLGRFLLKASDNLNRANIDLDYNRRGLIVSIYDMYRGQERVINEAASRAALSILKNRLNVDGYIESYWD